MTEKEKNQVGPKEAHDSPESNETSGMNETIGKNLSDRIVYNPEFEEREDVKKIYIVRGVCLYFVPIEGTDKYVFCSSDKKLQEWCEAVKGKNVKWKNIRFIVDAAKKYMKGETQLPERGNSSVYVNWRDNPVGTLQNILQKQGKMPEYSTPIEGSHGGIIVTLLVDGYESITQYASNQKEARKACAIRFAEKYLGIDVEAEQNLVTGEKPTSQQIRYQSEKMPSSFKVSPDVCGNWDVDAVSALQVFCQKNKIGMPRYIDMGTSQGYVTESRIRMEFGDFSTVQTAGTKKEAKQKCARAFYEKISESDSFGGETVLIGGESENKELDPSLFKGWRGSPWNALSSYCEYYGIELSIQDELDQTVMIVGNERFYTSDTDYDGNYKTDSQIREELAKYYYEEKIEPILRKQQREKINLALENVLDNFPVMDMSDHQGEDKIARSGVLNQLCAKAHLPNPQYEAAVLCGGIEKSRKFPSKLEMKSWREGEIKVMYVKIAGMDEKVRGEGKSYRDAQHDAAKNLLIKLWKRKIG